MFLVGADSVQTLRKNSIVIRGRPQNGCELGVRSGKLAYAGVVERGCGEVLGSQKAALID